MTFNPMLPLPQPDWDDRCRRARDRLYVATFAVVNETGNAAACDFDAARREFGAAILALDKRRRPEFYVR